MNYVIHNQNLSKNMNCILKALIDSLFDIASNIIRIYFYAVSHILGNQQFNNHLKSYKRIYTIKIIKLDLSETSLHTIFSSQMSRFFTLLMSEHAWRLKRFFFIRKDLLSFQICHDERVTLFSEIFCLHAFSFHYCTHTWVKNKSKT